MLPEGFHLELDFLGEEEERRLLAVLERLDFREIRMRGAVARRTSAHFGVDYDYESFRIAPAPAQPPELDALRGRCANLAGVGPDALAETLVQRYPPGAGIGWHRDSPAFGAVVGVSLASACRMRFQLGSGEARQTAAVELPRRSAYVLGGPARTRWQHSIPPTAALRYSITFRTLRKGRTAAGSAGDDATV